MSDDAGLASSPEPWTALLPWQRDWLVARLRDRDRAHHALLITGPVGLGKKALALNYAQALLCEEQVVVLDEPTHGLDPVWTQRFRDVVSALRYRAPRVTLPPRRVPL